MLLVKAPIILDYFEYTEHQKYKWLILKVLKKKGDCGERIVKTSETDRKPWSKCIGFLLKKHYF